MVNITIIPQVCVRFYKRLCTNIVFKRWYFFQKLGEKSQKNKEISPKYQHSIRKCSYIEGSCKIRALGKYTGLTTKPDHDRNLYFLVHDMDAGTTPLKF